MGWVGGVEVETHPGLRPPLSRGDLLRVVRKADLCEFASG